MSCRSAILVATLAIAALATGCVVQPPDTRVAPGASCAAAQPLHVIIGVAGHNLPDATRRAVVMGLTNQLRARVQPGALGMVVAAYPLTDQSIAAQPQRLDLPCLAEPPATPDLKQTPTFDRARVLREYRAQVERDRSEVAQAQRDFDTFAQQLLAFQPTARSTDIWGFLALAADEFGSIDASERHVVLIARDEEVQNTYCDGCHTLRGASVHFLAFDQPTPADQQRRRTDWADWLKAVGAASWTFTRSNEPLPALFPPTAEDPSHA